MPSMIKNNRKELEREAHTQTKDTTTHNHHKVASSRGFCDSFVIIVKSVEKFLTDLSSDSLDVNWVETRVATSVSSSLKLLISSINSWTVTERKRTKLIVVHKHFSITNYFSTTSSRSWVSNNILEKKITSFQIQSWKLT